MSYNFITKGMAAFLRVEGELDAVSVVNLKPMINQIADGRPRHLFVDLSGLRLIDASGVGTIVALFKAVRSYDGKMEVLGVREQPLAMLRLLKLDRVLTGHSVQ
jgi:anti-sigma B factor antagonist